MITNYRFRLYLGATLVATSPSLTTPSYVFNGLTSNTNYEVTMTNIDGAGNESPETARQPATTLAVIEPPPPPPLSDALTATDKTNIDAIVTSSMSANGVVGMSIMLTSPRGAYSKAFGTRAGISPTQPLTLDDHFRYASATKTFTAVATMMQIDLGTVHLSDTLDQFDTPTTVLSNVPNAHNITVQHMLQMRSGVYDFSTSSTFKNKFTLSPTAAWTEANSLAIIRANANRFTPGTQYEYSNSNYTLLAAICEAVTGRRIRDIFNQDIIAPLGLLETSWPADASGNGSSVLPPPVAGKSAWNPDYFGAAGGMVGTLGDLHKWGEELRDATLLGPTSHNLRLNTFASVPYPFEGPTTFGFGLGILQVASWFGFGGSLPGFNCCVLFEPATRSVIAVMENKQTGNQDDFTRVFHRVANYLYPGSADSAGFVFASNIALTGIPSAEAFGTMSVFIPGTISLNGIPSAEAFGNLSISRDVSDATFDNASATGTTRTSIPAFTIASDANAVVAWVSVQTSSGIASLDTAKATIGGIEMTKVVAGSGSYYLVGFTLLNPPTGSQSIALSGFPGVSSYYATGAASYKNVDAIGTPVVASANSNPGTVTTPSTVGGIVVNGFMFGGTKSTYNQTQRGFRAVAAFVNQGILFGDAPGAASVTFTETFTAANNWRGIAIPLING